jgi:hypothetical protein
LVVKRVFDGVAGATETSSGKATVCSPASVKYVIVALRHAHE